MGITACESSFMFNFKNSSVSFVVTGADDRAVSGSIHRRSQRYCNIYSGMKPHISIYRVLSGAEIGTDAVRVGSCIDGKQ